MADSAYKLFWITARKVIPPTLSITQKRGITVDEMVEIIVSVTKKGQATIPKKLREKYGITNKALLVEEVGKGIWLKPLPSPQEEFGSLKHLFPGKTAHEIIEEGRKEDYEREKRLLKLAGSPDV